MLACTVTWTALRCPPGYRRVRSRPRCAAASLATGSWVTRVASVSMFTAASGATWNCSSMVSGRTSTWATDVYTGARHATRPRRAG